METVDENFRRETLDSHNQDSLDFDQGRSPDKLSDLKGNPDD
jgi:hypothetical protein